MHVCCAHVTKKKIINGAPQFLEIFAIKTYVLTDRKVRCEFAFDSILSLGRRNY